MTIERAFIRVGGAAGAGKTALVERLLEKLGPLVLVARAERDDELGELEETCPPSDPELHRYRKAGACGVACIRFPVAEVDSDAFFMTDMMQGYSQAVVIEGDACLTSFDVEAFVAPAPRSHETLLVRKTRDRTREERAKADSIEKLLDEPGGAEQLMRRLLGDTAVDLVKRYNADRLEEAGAMMREAAQKARQNPPLPTEHWAVADRFEGIQHARLVVFNVHDDAERGRAERMIVEVARIRKDKPVFDDVLGYRGRRTPITAVAANLADPRDPGTRKAVARVKRVVPQSA